MEELQQKANRLEGENQELRQRLQAAEAMIKKLTEQLKQNSRNSSWPSSRDKSRSPKPKSQRKKSERKAGGQNGHKGYTLEMEAEPDVVEVIRPTRCSDCNCEIGEESKVEEVEKRQQLDLPPLQYITTEYQVETVRCDKCGKLEKGEFPEGVTQPVQYGPQVKQLAVYMKTEQFIPYERSKQQLSDLFGLPVSVGSLQNFIGLAAKKVEPETEKIKEAVAKSDVVHADETGFYIGGKRHWLHTASTQQLSYYAPHARRGKDAPNEIGILPKVTGVLVHDNWSSYKSYKQAEHALCNAHHLRDLTAVVENDNQQWAASMIDCLLDAKSLVEGAATAGDSALSDNSLSQLNARYDEIVKLGLDENPLPPPPTEPKRGRVAKGKARNLVERFEQRKPDILRFVHDFNVPFDNNLAERDIRMMKVQQKVSGCFRSEDGAKQFCRIRSYTATIRKQGRSVWNALGSLFSGPVTSPIPPPSPT